MKRDKSSKKSTPTKATKPRQYMAAVRIEGEQEVFVFDRKADRDRFLKDVELREGVEWLKGDPIR